LLGRHDHAGGAKAALQAMLVPEGLLERVQGRALGETLDRRDPRSVGLDREHRARLHTVSVNFDGARAAVARIAADVGAGKPRLFPDVVH